MNNFKFRLAKILHRWACKLEVDLNRQIHIKKEDYYKEIFKDRMTDDTYEAAWFMTQGAVFERVRVQKLSDAQAQKRGYPDQWRIYLKNRTLFLCMFC